MTDASVSPTGSHSVAVVICMFTAERLQQVAAAVDSIGEQTLRPTEVVVVVDGTEELAEQVRDTLGMPRGGVGVLCLGSNQGVAVARTRGVQQVDADLVAFLDDDAEADPRWLEQLSTPMLDERVIGVSGRSVPIFGGPRPPWLPDEFLWTVGCSYRGMPTGIERVRNFYGGCAVVRRDMFLAVGGFEAGAGHFGRFVGGAEEADFCLRASQKTGGVFMFNPGAVIRHHVPPARLTFGYFARRCYSEGIMKSQMASRLDPGSLDPERAFARAMPRAVIRTALTRGERARAFGILTGVVTVLAGLAVGRMGGEPSDVAP